MNKSLEDVIVRNNYPRIYGVTYFVKNMLNHHDSSLVEMETRSLFKMLGFNEYDSLLIFFRFTKDRFTDDKN